MSPDDDAIRDGFVGAVGNTPLIRLPGPSRATGCGILGKAEFLNPGGSVKDRAALGMIQQAEQDGALRPGGLIVEGTAGNTGIGLALVANAKGYRTLIVMPDNQSQEKKDMLRLCGAEVMEVPAAPYKEPGNYVRVSERVAADKAKTEPDGVLWANQWDNPANWGMHYRTTGPEIWRQTEGTLDAFICAIGTGGTMAGTSKYLKEVNPDVTIGLADPLGAAMFQYFTDGKLESEGSSIAEGIGQSRITGNVAEAQVDLPIRVADAEALPVLFDLLRHDGLCLGGSSAINVTGAIRLAEKLGPGHTIVTLLGDGGQRYQSKLYNPVFLRDNDLPVPDWM